MESAMPGIRELARQAEFIGFIQGDPHRVTSRDTATQFVSVDTAEAVKGDLPLRQGALTYLYSTPRNRQGYTNRLPEKSEALVFARPGIVLDRPGWVAIALFPLRYWPAPGRGVIGTLGGGRLYGRKSLPLAEVRQLLRPAVGGNRSAAERLDPILAAVSNAVEGLPQPLPHKLVWEETNALVAAIERGSTTRADIEKLFRQQDGGLSFPAATRYYREPEVMVEVPFDQTGGNGKPTNRVNGPLRIYRSLFHCD